MDWTVWILYYLCLGISPINHYKINPIDRDPIEWSIEFDTFKGLIEHPIDTNALTQSL
jgi:hypothetical protein